MKFRKLKNWRIFNSSYGDSSKGEKSEIPPDSIGPVAKRRIEEIREETIVFLPFVVALLIFLFLA